jgi:hypothetical protein
MRPRQHPEHDEPDPRYAAKQVYITVAGKRHRSHSPCTLRGGTMLPEGGRSTATIRASGRRGACKATMMGDCASAVGKRGTSRRITTKWMRRGEEQRRAKKSKDSLRELIRQELELMDDGRRGKLKFKLLERNFRE